MIIVVLAWQIFEPGSQIYVFFPIRKAGQYPKFTSYWRGPYKVLSNLTDLTYKVDCGPRGRPQVIHVDMMRKKYPQTLRGEACDEKRSAPEKGPESLDIEDSNLEHNEKSDRSDDEDGVMPQRSRGKPQWMENYVMY